MKVLWTTAAWADVDRLHAFLVEREVESADALFDKLANSPDRLRNFPRRGPRLSEYDPREVRELRVGQYVLRYELVANDVLVLRFFHAREDRY